jgi:hypothetical protein
VAADWLLYFIPVACSLLGEDCVGDNL